MTTGKMMRWGNRTQWLVAMVVISTGRFLICLLAGRDRSDSLESPLELRARSKCLVSAEMEV